MIDGVEDDEQTRRLEGEPVEAPSTTWKMRRVLRRLARIDLDDPNLRQAVESLKVSAELALKEIKASEVGHPQLDVARRKAIDNRREEADRRHAVVAPIIRRLRGEGKSTLREIAEALDAMGIQTSSGGKWSPGSVSWIEKNSSNDK